MSFKRETPKLKSYTQYKADGRPNCWWEYNINPITMWGVNKQHLYK